MFWALWVTPAKEFPPKIDTHVSSESSFFCCECTSGWADFVFSLHLCPRMCTHTRTTHQRDILKLYYNSDLLPPVSVIVCSLLPAKIFLLLLFSVFGLFSKVFSCKSVLLLVVIWTWICPMTWGQQMFTQIKSHSNKAQYDTKGSVTSANTSTFSY